MRARKTVMKKGDFNKYGTWEDKAFLVRKGFFSSNSHMTTTVYNTDMQTNHGTRRDNLEERWLILKTVRKLIDIHHPHYFFILFFLLFD